MRLPIFMTLMVTLSACATTPSGPVTWHEDSYPDYRIRYAEGLAEDASNIADLTQHSIAALQAEFGVDSQTWSEDFDLQVVLHASATNKAGPGRATIRTSRSMGRISAELHMLAPSLHPVSGRTAVGLPFDGAYFAKLVTHEVSTLFLEYVTARKGRGWGIYEAPAWFVQGYQEYLGLSRSSPEAAEVAETYRNQAVADRNRVRMELRVRNDYVDGALLVQFLHERFGEAVIQRVLESNRNLFWDALTDETGLDEVALKSGYDEWLDQ